MENLVKVSTYARIHGISVQTVYNKVESGLLDTIKIDGVLFIKLNKNEE